MNISKFKRAAAFLLALLMLPGCFGTALAQASWGVGLMRGSANSSRSSAKALPPTADFSFVRVLISTGFSSRLELDLYGEYYFEGGPEFGSCGAPFPIRVSLSGGVVTAVARDTGAVLASGQELWLRRVHTHYMAGYAKLTYSGNSSTQGRKYLGDLRFFVEDGQLNLVNRVPMTYYIYGIVGYELNVYCEPEALKAQAVAAQSFALYYMNTDRSFDVKDGWTSSLYQAYRGYRDDRLATMPFCREVLGEVLSYNGTFIPIFYGHTNGGETCLPSHMWGGTSNDAAYGVAIDDIELESGDSIDVVNIEFGGTGDNSRLLDFILLKIRGLYGANALSVDSIDGFYVFDPLPGTQRNMRRLHVEAGVRVDRYGSGGRGREAEPSAEPTSEPSSEPTAEPTAEPTPAPTEVPGPTIENFTFECDTSELRSFALTDADGSGDDYSSSKYVFTHNYLIYWGVETENGYRLNFARHGHGIGLSQIGAQTRANPATYCQNYHEILAFYYPHFDLIEVRMDEPETMDDPDAYVSEIAAYGVCTRDGAQLRLGASDNSQLLATGVLNEHIDVLGVTDSGWYNVILRGIRGYMKLDSSRICLFPSPEGGVFLTAEGSITAATKLRSEPYVTTATAIVTLPVGTDFTCCAQVGKWLYITTQDGQTGFVSSLSVELLGARETVGMSSIAVPDRRMSRFIILPPRVKLAN